MSIDAKRRFASAAFVVLLALSVVWPSPVVTINQLCCHAAIAVDDYSFLGREAPSWDAVYWCLCGLLLIAILLSVDFGFWILDFGLKRAATNPKSKIQNPKWILTALLTALVAALIWRFLDTPITAFAERIGSSSTDDLIRLANRFGGGMNPPMIILFYFVAGMVYRMRRWIDYAVAMALAGATAGVLVQIVKFAVGRTRPELWLGAFHHARASASSFPSGHTVGAFALAGVLIFGAESRTLRITAALLALAVAVSRVLAFRHWTSDVFASAAIGLLAAHLFVTAVTTESEARP
jgi:undecaprenyl-diphosphatase